MYVASVTTSLAAFTWSPFLLPLVVAASLIVASAVLLLYPPQVRAVGGIWRWTLPVFRIVAMAALVGSLLKPVLVRPKTIEERGTVVVLIDQSRSMSVKDLATDTEAGRAQVVALADMLGRLPAGARSKAVAGLFDAVSRLVSLADDATNVKNELDFARISGRETQPLSTRFEQTIESLADAAQKAEKIANELHVQPGRLTALAHVNQDPRHANDVQTIRTWVDEVRRKTGTSQVSFDSQLYEKTPQVKAICDELAAMSRLQLIEEALLDPKAGLLKRLDPKTPVALFSFANEISRVTQHITAGTTKPTFALEPVGTASDLHGAIQSAMDSVGAKAVEAIIVFSDGREIAAEGDVHYSGQRAHVPVIAVSVASPNLRDIAISAIDLPRSQYVGETLHARVEVRNTIEPSHITGLARLSLGSTIATSQPVHFRDGKPEPIDFHVKLDKPGPTRVSISLPPQKEEVSVLNNQVERWIKSLTQKLKVTVIGNSPGWDLRYLRTTLSRTPWVEMSEHMLGGDDLMLSMSAEDLLEQDVVVLFDVATSSLTRDHWSAIRRLASERGGGVILVAGDDHLPAEYAGPDFSDLLPWAKGRPVWRTWPGEAAYYRVNPVAGADLRLDPDPQEDQRRWNDLKAFYRYLEMPPLRASARPLLLERETRAPILSQADLGRGRIFLLGMNESWRWRYRVGDRDFDRFWLQLLRHAAEEPYALTNGSVSLDADTFSVSPKEPVHVRMRVNSEGFREALPSQLELSVRRQGSVYQNYLLRAVGSADSGRYEATISGLPIGDYELRPPDLVLSRVVGDMSLPLHVIDNTEAEMRDLSGDIENLRQIAQSTGGKQIVLEEVASVPQLLADVSSRQPRVVELPLWDSYYLFLFVLACLAAEWSLRKHFGLA